MPERYYEISSERDVPYSEDQIDYVGSEHFLPNVNDEPRRKALALGFGWALSSFLKNHDTRGD